MNSDDRRDKQDEPDSQGLSYPKERFELRRHISLMMINGEGIPLEHLKAADGIVSNPLSKDTVGRIQELIDRDPATPQRPKEGGEQ